MKWNNIHPKAQWATYGVLGWAIVVALLSQYAPGYEPNASVSAAVGALFAFAGGWAGSSQEGESSGKTS